MGTVQEPLRKAAIFLRSLPAEQRACLLDKLEAKQAVAVCETLNRLADVPNEEQEAVAREFQENNEHPPREPAEEKSVPFGFLHDFTADDLGILFADERSQTVATVLSFLPPVLAGEVLDRLPSDRQISVVCRIATMTSPSPEIVEEIENVLRPKVVAIPEPEPEPEPLAPGVANVIHILNAMTPSNERQLLNELAESDPDLVRQIRRGMFGVDVALYPECTAEMMGAAG
jgi:flagellar motor switch protein FliG